MGPVSVVELSSAEHSYLRHAHGARGRKGHGRNPQPHDLFKKHRGKRRPCAPLAVTRNEKGLFAGCRVGEHLFHDAFCDLPISCLSHLREHVLVREQALLPSQYQVLVT